MQFAYANVEDLKKLDVSKRIQANEQRAAQQALCPCCDGLVECKLVNNVWQWIHLSKQVRCTAKRFAKGTKTT